MAMVWKAGPMSSTECFTTGRISRRRSATYVAKLLRGSKAADLPIEQAERYRLVINLKTANALGLSIPTSLLATADEVIE